MTRDSDDLSYALTFSETYNEEDPGCTEDHRHEWCEQPSGSVSVFVESLYRFNRDLGGHYQIAPNNYDLVYECEDVSVGDTAYVVIVEYTDGDTFGYHGYWTVPGLYASREKAEDCIRKCESENDSGHAYRSWDGYFSHLCSARIEEMTVKA